MAMSITSAEERRERTRQMNNALASVRMEGLEPSEEAKSIFQRHVDGDLTEAEMRTALDELHDQKYGPVRLSRDARSKKPA